MGQLVRLVTGDQQGTAVVELGLAAPILAVMLIGMVDLSNAYSRKLTIEQAAQRGVEKIMQTTEDGTVDTTARAEIVSAAGVPDANVTMTDNLECTNKSTGLRRVLTPDQDCDDATEYHSRYLLVTVTDEFSPMFPIKFGANSNGKYPIKVRVGMRTQ
jgi:Flp pilus assembly protein TadG